MSISMIIGAGISFNAGLPLVSGISQKFLKRPFEDKEIGYLMSYLVDYYQAEQNEEIVNYENFSSFFITLGIASDID